MSFRHLSYSDISDLKKLLRAHLDPNKPSNDSRSNNTGSSFISSFQQNLHVNIQQKHANNTHENTT